MRKTVIGGLFSGLFSSVASAGELEDRGFLLGHEKQLHLQETVPEGRNWNADLAVGTLSFGEDHVYAAEILGTWAKADGTFLWAWANAGSGFPDKILAQSKAARELGTTLSDDRLTERKHPMQENDVFELMIAVSGLLPEVRAVYRGPHGGGAAFLVIVDPKLDLGAPDPVRITRVITEGLAAGVVKDHRVAVGSYLASRGFELNQASDPLVATHPGGAALSVSFDEMGRVDTVTTTASP